MNFVIHVNTFITNDKKQVLLVKELKEKVFGLLNMPGGHLEFGEGLVVGAKREVMEEVGVEIEMEGLIGIYAGIGENHCLGFVFAGKISSGVPVGNKNEVSYCGWYGMDEVLALPDEQILNPNLKKAIVRYRSGKLGGMELVAAI